MKTMSIPSTMAVVDEGDGAFSEEEKAEIELAIIFSPLSILSILFLCVAFHSLTPCVVVQSRLIW